MNYKALITIILAGGICLLVFTAWKGISMRDVTVVENPYEEGLKFDAKQKRYAELGWRIIAPQMLKKEGQLSVSVLDKNGAPLKDAAVEFDLSRLGSPETSKINATPSQDGRYVAKVAFPATGVWELRVKVSQGSDTLSYDSKIRIEG